MNKLDEARRIMERGGAVDIKIAEDRNGVLVMGRFSGQVHGGHTGIDANTSNDPRDLARRLVRIAETEARPAKPPSPEPGEPPPASDVEVGGGDWFGAEMLAAEGEEGESVGHEEAHSSPPAGPETRITDESRTDSRQREDGRPDEAPNPVAYGGIALLPDDLAAARDKAIALITANAETKLDALRERLNRAAETVQTFNSLHALGAPISDELRREHADAESVRLAEAAVLREMMALCAAARAADLDTLKAMLAEL